MQLNIDQRNLGFILKQPNPKYICFPTNLHINPKQDTVYLYGKCRNLIINDFPDIHQVYTKMLKEGRDGVELFKVIGSNILLSFPTRQTWLSYTNKNLITRSCCELLVLQQNGGLIDGLPIYLPLQIDGFPNFNLDDLINHIQPYLKRVKNLSIVLL